jgi:putative acyl-CoA dehydrogenase
MATLHPFAATAEDPGDAHATAPNTPPQRVGDNLLDGDRALLEALRREGGTAHEDEVRALGEALAAPAVVGWGFDANAHPPEHVPYDREGLRTDEIAFHPSWHAIMRLSVEHGVGGSAWADRRPGAHVARAAKFLLTAQVEAGQTCPLAMTYSCVPALRLDAGVAAVWEGPATSRAYDTRPLPIAEKAGALIGMALTERVGGSDVRASTTVAEPQSDGAYAVTGAKWFVSAVQSDAFFVLAQAPGGLSCLLVPRRLPDGSPNGFRVDRLKDKLGNRSNPTAEVELRGARATLVGEEGRGVRAIMEMIAGTRHDCVLGSTAVMRLGTAEAIHHAEHRSAFGRALARQPAMTAVLADLAIETEAATAAALRLTRAYEQAHAGDEQAEAFRRLAAPVLKYWICKRAPAHAAEALECQGGFGYVEDSRLARCYREAPLMSIWEGSGNIQALDVARALQRSSQTAEALLAEIALAAGTDPRLDAAAAELRALLGTDDEAAARRVAGLAARCVQGSLLVRHAPPCVADAFCATRLGASGHEAFGVLPRGTDAAGIVARHRPER